MGSITVFVVIYSAKIKKYICQSLGWGHFYSSIKSSTVKVILLCLVERLYILHDVSPFVQAIQ